MTARPDHVDPVTPPSIPPPVTPDDERAWYAPAILDQYVVRSGIVATVAESPDGPNPFKYTVREPIRTATEEAALATVRQHFAEVDPTRPRTREGVGERYAAGLGQKYHQIIDDLVSLDHGARRRVIYYALRDLRCLGAATPLALDDRVDVGDPTGEHLVVHTADFAPATSTFPADLPHLDRVLAERLHRRTVQFAGFDIPVVLYREHLVDGSPFDGAYAVVEPDLLPGDRDLIEACREHIWETTVEEPGVDPATFVRDRAEAFFARRLGASQDWLERFSHRVRGALAQAGLATPAVEDRYVAGRREDLVYTVLREFVGDGELTVPIRDPALEDIEANRVGEAITVVPRHPTISGRVPTNLQFEEETAFTNVVTQLAARDGVQLDASTPTATVTLTLAESAPHETIRCAVALPTVSEDGPHVSIRKQRADPLTPVDLLKRNAVPTELVALLWLLYEHHGVVVFAGPTAVGKTTLLNAHLPFLGPDDRVVSIDTGAREIQLPAATGVTLSTQDHHGPNPVSMSELQAQAAVLNPDMEIIADLSTPEHFRTFGQSIQSGHGLLGTAQATDVTRFVTQAIEQGLAPSLIAEIDIVVFSRHVDGERFVGTVIEFLTPSEAGPDAQTVTCAGSSIQYRVVCRRRSDGEYAFPAGDDGELAPGTMARLAASEHRAVSDLEREFKRTKRYVRYLQKAGIDDAVALRELLADLRRDEAATLERLSEK